MATTHVFIVNGITFKYHLEYMFAGTCAKSDILYLDDANYKNTRKKEDGITSGQEIATVGMIADISRIRDKDKIIFYLIKNKYEGAFYGVFRAVGEPFYNSMGNNYLKDELGLALNFRIKMQPDEVYANGVTEHQALDYIEGIDNPNQMCWSLIYRKLGAGRGCTMITTKESDSLIELIRCRNNGALSGEGFTYDALNGCIKIYSKTKQYCGATPQIDILNRLKVKKNRKIAYEVHLQAYITKNIDKEPLSSLLNIDTKSKLWIGNEVSCGFGEQSIDVMTIQEMGDVVNINVIELKYDLPSVDIVCKQLSWYIEWVRQYIASTYVGKLVNICPVIIAAKFNEESDKKAEFLRECKEHKYIERDNVKVANVKYIYFEINETIEFKEQKVK